MKRGWMKVSLECSWDLIPKKYFNTHTQTLICQGLRNASLSCKKLSSKVWLVQKTNDLGDPETTGRKLFWICFDHFYSWKQKPEPKAWYLHCLLILSVRRINKIRGLSRGRNFFINLSQSTAENEIFDLSLDFTNCATLLTVHMLSQWIINIWNKRQQRKEWLNLK